MFFSSPVTVVYTSGIQELTHRLCPPTAVMSGVVSGAGKQAKGLLINAVAYWVLALPAALLLAFTFGRGVEGLYSGMVLGPLAQCCCYLWLVGRLRWREEAAAARRRLQDASTET